jgi:hypothetical protein
MTPPMPSCHTINVPPAPAATAGELRATVPLIKWGASRLKEACSTGAPVASTARVNTAGGSLALTAVIRKARPSHTAWGR